MQHTNPASQCDLTLANSFRCVLKCQAFFSHVNIACLAGSVQFPNALREIRLPDVQKMEVVNCLRKRDKLVNLMKPGIDAI